MFVAAWTLCVNALSVPVFAVTRPMCIVLDAGHGGIDGGVVGRETGIKESDLNLSVTVKLKTILQQAGFDVVLTRKTEAGLYGAATKGFKKRDMQRRKEIIEESKPIAMISIHQNYFPIRASRGGRVFYRKGSESGRQLAENIQRAFNDLYLEENVKERSAATGDYYMLKCTEYTSVIAECGFLSNKADEALLVTEEFQEKLAQSIYEGLAAYLAAVSGASTGAWRHFRVFRKYRPFLLILEVGFYECGKFFCFDVSRRKTFRLILLRLKTPAIACILQGIMV